MEIEKLIEKEVPKLDLPNGLKKAPEYKLVNKKKKREKIGRIRRRNLPLQYRSMMFFYPHQ